MTLNSKIISLKSSSAIFLATLLVVGTIAIILPSVQAQPYEMNNGYGSSEPQPEYTNNNSYEPKYPSYLKNYKQEYSSDNSYYDSNDIKSVINKLKCINNNLNINGNNAGDVNIGNKGQGYSGGYSSNGGGYNGNEGIYDNGYDNKRDKGFECIINNNNNNTVIGGGGEDGNDTGGNNPPPPPDGNACEDCFNLNTTVVNIINEQLTGNNPINVIPGIVVIPGSVNDITGLCDFLATALDVGTLFQTESDLLLVINAILAEGPPPDPVLSEESLADLIECLLDVDFIETSIRLVESADADGSTIALDNNIDTMDFNINTAGGLTASSFSSPPTIAQGTEDLTALEKITKLKQQWLGLLP
jgi:hypothetical protein